MITNSELTLYHKTIDKVDKMEKWERINFKYVWWFGGKNAGIKKGYVNANDVDIRIPYNKNNIDINKISIGDILVKGNLSLDIIEQKDLKKYDVYNIVSISNNDFGNNKHIHIGGK